tara:strand:- start:73 stop:570 length:498 start_codon:yes stop_codon:yes gene_type:complete
VDCTKNRKPFGEFRINPKTYILLPPPHNMDQKKHIVAVTALIKNFKGDKFLMVKRHQNEIAFAGKWAFPGGKVERKESILESLKREVLEEAGLDIYDEKVFLKDYTFVRPDDQNVVGMTFLVKAMNEAVKISEDFEDFVWISPEDLPNYDHIPGMEEEVALAFQK